MNTIKEAIQNSAMKYSNNIAFYEKVDKEYVGITYKKLYEDLNNLGKSLLDMGLKDKYIGVIGNNSYEWALAYLATVCGLGHVVPLDRQMTSREINNCLERMDIDTLIYSKELEKNIDKDKCNTICMQTELHDLIENGKTIENDYENLPVNDKDPAVFIFTSGTTSKPKVVMLSNENIMYNVENSDQHLIIDEKDKFLSILPMHHTFEATLGFITPLCFGCSIIHVDNLKNIQRDILSMNPTVIIGVPRILEMFDQKITKEIKRQEKTELIEKMKKITNLIPVLRKLVYKDIHKSFGGNLKSILVGGAPVDPDVVKRLREYGFTIIPGYGLTECAPLVSGNTSKKCKNESAGIPLRGTDVKIVNSNEDGIGEIVVKGKNVMLGYYNNEEATNEAIVDGYFHTGDLGCIDKDGFIMIKGRSKNVIVTQNGKNIYPEELETIVEKSDNIKQAVVSSGVDRKGNEVVKVEVVLIDKLLEKFNNNEKYKEEITKVINDYIKEVNNQIAEYKRIRQVVLKSEPFEETTTQKVKRYTSK